MRGPALALGVAIVLLAGGAVLLLTQLAGERERRVAAERRAQALADSLRAVAVVRPARGETPVVDTVVSSLLQSWEEDQLRRRGLDEPATELLQDLARHPELIPATGTHGGTMRFYPSRSTVLTNEWVLGYFEDGHNAGHGLFAYTVDDSGRIRWRRIAGHLD